MWYTGVCTHVFVIEWNQRGVVLVPVFCRSGERHLAMSLYKVKAKSLCDMYVP